MSWLDFEVIMHHIFISCVTTNAFVYFTLLARTFKREVYNRFLLQITFSRENTTYEYTCNYAKLTPYTCLLDLEGVIFFMPECNIITHAIDFV